MNHKPLFASQRLRAVLIAILFIFGLGGTAWPVAAQNSPVQMKATPAFGGNFKYGEWLPVMVELTNTGGDLDGQIDILVTGSQGALVFRAPVALPAGAHKRVPVYVLPNNFSRELEVRFISQGSTLTTTKASVRPQPNISYFIGLLAPQRGALSLMSLVTFQRQERPKVFVDLTVDDLPGRAEGLRAFDVLVVNDTDTSKLTPDQSAALAAWVQQGGRLVIGGGTNAQQTLSGLPAALLPVKLQSTGEVSADALQPLVDFAGNKALHPAGAIIAARGAPNASRILAGDAALPLIQERAWGNGAVDFVALDLSGAPFDGWTGSQAFWENLLGPNRAFPENLPFDVSPRQYRANALSYAVSNIPSLDLPSIQGLSLLLGLYVLVVGPINYLVLRWRKRLQFAWITIPALTALFAAAAFGIGYGLRGNDLILNKVALVETRPDGAADVTSYMGLFSPRMQSYAVNIQDSSLISPMNYDMGGFNGGVANGVATDGGEMVFVQGSPSQVRGLTVNQWAMQSFMSEGVWDNFGAITGSLRMENETLVGTVRNQTHYTLKDAVLTIQSRFVRLGDLAPGEEKAIDLGLSNLQSDRFGTPLSYKLYQEPYPNGRQPRAVQLKSNIINSVFENGPWAKLSSSIRPPGATGPLSGILVLGWLDQAPPNVEVANNRLSQTTTALVYTSLNYDLPPSGILAIPPGMIAGAVTHMPPDAGTCGASGSIHLTKGEAVMEFTIPENLKGYSVDALKLALWQDNGNIDAMPAVALYNWQDKVWSNIKEPIQGTNVVAKAAPYVNENGLVRVQVGARNEMMGCIYVDLGMQAHAISGGS